MTKEKNDLKELKDTYKKIQKSYGLPDFEKLNEDFSIEKLSDIESDFLVREIRKLVADKILNLLRMVETIINPSNAPMVVFSIVKTLNEADKKKLADIYNKLAKKEVEVILLDIEFSEKREAEYIKTSHKEWQEIKKELTSIFENIKNKWDDKVEKNNKGYFG